MGTRGNIIMICDYPSEDLNQDSGSLKANTPVPIYVDQFLPDGRGSKILINLRSHCFVKRAIDDPSRIRLT